MLHPFFSNFWVKFNQLTSQRMLSATAVNTAGIQSGVFLLGAEKRLMQLNCQLNSSSRLSLTACDPWEKEETF